MTDDLERRLADAFHRAPLPAAPATLADALVRVPDAPVVVRRRSRRSSLWGALGLAAVLALGSAIAVSIGQRGVAPSPSDAASVSPTGPTGPAVLGVVLDLEPSDGVPASADELAALVEVVGRRMEAAGYGGVAVTLVGDTGVVVEIPSGATEGDIRALVTRTGRLDIVPLGDQSADPGDVLDLGVNPPLLGGDALASATAANDDAFGRVLQLTLERAAARTFAAYTEANVGKYVAIALDGRVISAPMILAAIPGGRVQIASDRIGGFEADELRDLVAILTSGPLPIPLR